VALAAAVGRPDPRAGELPVAFVSLVPGAEATEDELCDFAAERISERAAVPKAIHVLPDLPLTAVGKIFKPELRRMATRLILEQALEPIAEGGGSISVDVVPDEVHGTKAVVTLSGGDAGSLEDRAREIVGGYPVAFEIIVG
jgi:fatty-acyl-CoA synthase